jgi:8-oxo-dGTP diphosphatase
VTGVLPDEAFASLTRLAAAESVQQLVVGGIVQHEGAILLLKRPEADFMGGIWELPSGKVEPDEALDDALIREVHEETGLTVTDIRHYLGSFDYQGGSGKKSRQFNFVVSVAKPESVKLTEHDAYVWMPVTDDLPVTDAVKAVLGKYRSSRIG